MKALQISRLGAPEEVVELADIPEPAAPGPGEVLVASEYAPVNHSEILKIVGRYPLLPASFPAGVGNDGVARILSLGSGVRGLRPGDRVLVPAGHASLTGIRDTKSRLSKFQRGDDDGVEACSAFSPLHSALLTV